MFGGSAPGPAPAQQAELAADIGHHDGVDDRLTRLEHVPGNGAWAKRRALGEGNRLGLIRGDSGGGCAYVIQARVPEPALQQVSVRRSERDEAEATQEVRSWADEESDNENETTQAIDVKNR